MVPRVVVLDLEGVYVAVRRNKVCSFGSRLLQLNACVVQPLRSVEHPFLVVYFGLATATQVFTRITNLCREFSVLEIFVLGFRRLASPDTEEPADHRSVVFDLCRSFWEFNIDNIGFVEKFLRQGPEL